MDRVLIEIAQHERAFERSYEKRCYFVGICSGAHLSAFYTPVDNAMDGITPVVRGNQSEGFALMISHGTNLFKSLGNVVASLTFGIPVNCISKRSNPIANPPSGGIP